METAQTQRAAKLTCVIVRRAGGLSPRTTPPGSTRQLVSQHRARSFRADKTNGRPPTKWPFEGKWPASPPNRHPVSGSSSSPAPLDSIPDGEVHGRTHIERDPAIFTDETSMQPIGTNEVAQNANQELLDRARRSIAGGDSSTMRVLPYHLPLVASHGRGSRVWDVEGNEYID